MCVVLHKKKNEIRKNESFCLVILSYFCSKCSSSRRSGKTWRAESVVVSIYLNEVHEAKTEFVQINI